MGWCYDFKLPLVTSHTGEAWLIASTYREQKSALHIELKEVALLTA